MINRKSIRWVNRTPRMYRFEPTCNEYLIVNKNTDTHGTNLIREEICDELIIIAPPIPNRIIKRM